MFETLLPITSALILLSLAIIVIARKRDTASVSLGVALLLLAMTEVADWLPFTRWYNLNTVSIGFIVPVSLLPASLLFYSLTYARNVNDKTIAAFWKVLLALSAAFPLSIAFFPATAFFYAPDVQAERMLFLDSVGFWFYMGILVYCVFSLMNLEVTFSATSGSDRYKIKFEVIGFAAILAVLIFYFSQGLLYRTINMNLTPVRSGVFIIAAILLGYSKLFRGNSVAIVVSRYVFYRSLTLFLVGIYLLVLGFIGEGIRYLGDSFSRNLALVTAFAVGIALFLFLFSEQVRRRAKVLVNKHFYHHKHDYREEWLGFTGRLASCRSLDEVMTAVLTTYRETFGLKGCSLYLPNGAATAFDRSAWLGVVGARAAISTATPLVTYFSDTGRVFNPSHTEYRPDERESEFVSATDARLIVPLRDKETVRGFVVLGEQLAPEEYTYEDYDLMKTFARQALLSLDNFRLADELAESREMAAVAKVSSFVVHDLKNLTSGLSMLLENARDYLHEPEFQRDMLDTIRNSLARMNKLTQRLKMTPRESSPPSQPADIRVLVEETAAEVDRTYGQGRITLEGVSAVSLVNPDQIRNVVRNLILNALEATAENGTIRVDTGAEGARAFIRVEDTGCGMTDEFLTHELFRPFRTTKKKGLGIGLYQCKQIIESHGGTIEARSEVGVGSVFTVWLPELRERTCATG
jgi:putative PEP-CTERM system histidine kinase